MYLTLGIIGRGSHPLGCEHRLIQNRLIENRLIQNRLIDNRLMMLERPPPSRHATAVRAGAGTRFETALDVTILEALCPCFVFALP